MNDWHLLEEWSRDGSETAFATLVERHVALVYSAARRQVYGDAALAEEVTQQTFCLLSRKAGTLRPGGSLAGWLYQTAGNVARERLRTDRRRRLREQQAVDWDSVGIDSMTNPTPAPTWETLAPALDFALSQLPAADREVLVARFFERRSMRDVGTVFGVSEDAAKVRVSRAIKRLRDLLARAGVCATGDVLAGLMSEHAVGGVPEGLQASVLQAVKLRGMAIGGGRRLRRIGRPVDPVTPANRCDRPGLGGGRAFGRAPGASGRNLLSGIEGEVSRRRGGGNRCVETRRDGQIEVR